jgi:ubiquinone/menaquinone biosynthesis C-methylase UbiE
MLEQETMNSLSFDPMVKLYDESRVFDTGCFNAAIACLADRFPPTGYRRLLEPGIGTGRIAIPLAALGFEVTGVDISGEMLGVLKERLAESGGHLPVTFRQGDAARLPYPANYFNIAVVVHLFYFIEKWRVAADELLRVVCPGGPIILMHTGMGMEVPSLNERYKEICAEHGCVIRPVGAVSTGEVVDYFGERGCCADWLKDRWQWQSRIRYSEAIAFLRKRAYSFTTVASDAVHSLAMAQIEAEVTAKHGSVMAEVTVPNQVYMVVVLRQ